jgi:hypothetical protein
LAALNLASRPAVLSLPRPLTLVGAARVHAPVAGQIPDRRQHLVVRRLLAAPQEPGHGARESPSDGYGDRQRARVWMSVGKRKSCVEFGGDCVYLLAGPLWAASRQNRAVRTFTRAGLQERGSSCGNSQAVVRQPVSPVSPVVANLSAVTRIAGLPGLRRRSGRPGSSSSGANGSRWCPALWGPTAGPSVDIGRQLPGKSWQPGQARST